MHICRPGHCLSVRRCDLLTRLTGLQCLQTSGICMRGGVYTVDWEKGGLERAGRRLQWDVILSRPETQGLT